MKRILNKIVIVVTCTAISFNLFIVFMFSLRLLGLIDSLFFGDMISITSYIITLSSMVISGLLLFLSKNKKTKILFALNGANLFILVICLLIVLINYNSALLSF